jgi:hypothetical protein
MVGLRDRDAASGSVDRSSTAMPNAEKSLRIARVSEGCLNAPPWPGDNDNSFLPSLFMLN